MPNIFVTPARHHSLARADQWLVPPPSPEPLRRAWDYTFHTDLAITQPILPHKPIRLNTGFVLIKTVIGVKTSHTHIDTGLAVFVIWVAALEFRIIQYVLREFDDVNIVMVTPAHSLSSEKMGSANNIR